MYTLQCITETAIHHIPSVVHIPRPFKVLRGEIQRVVVRAQTLPSSSSPCDMHSKMSLFCNLSSSVFLISKVFICLLTSLMIHFSSVPSLRSVFFPFGRCLTLSVLRFVNSVFSICFPFYRCYC